jgi:hypothetical protein
VKKYLLPSALILALGLVGALAQNINKSLQQSQSPGAFGVDSSNNVYFPAHVLSNGKSPTISSGTVVGTDFQGTITEASNSIGGVLTFSKAYLAAPNCVLTAQAPGVALATPIAYSTVTTSLTYSHLSQVSKLLSYICSGAQ